MSFINYLNSFLEIRITRVIQKIHAKATMLGAFFLILPIKSFSVQKPLHLENAVKPAVFSLSMVMMHDVLSPTGAARYFAYCMLGAYEIVSGNDIETFALKKNINQYPKINFTDVKGYDRDIAAVLCIYESGKSLLPSGSMMQKNEDDFLNFLTKSKITKQTITASLLVAQDISRQIVAWSKTDGYSKLSSRLRYTPAKGEGYWYPTPPAYMEPVDPHWNTLRTFFIDSAAQFTPERPTHFSKDSTSAFYKIAHDVYSATKNATSEQKEIAAFWDCNPFALVTAGHMSLGFKKISPGAHWMNITGIACQQAKLDMKAVITAHTLVALSLHDAFISCWDEKYRSNRIRPETFINRNIDVSWQPMLQTPPFPEYPSGHSVASTAVAVILSGLLGNNFSYTDDTELMFELKPRKFKSFIQAADEAAISRFYGGIHYMDAIENGQKQGKQIGESIVRKLGLSQSSLKTNEKDVAGK
ncbi:vanadium-dependent haloperoxidase [Rubrolithibacter danxiaensis]|uniref:vanadium-dependent haloperoxidase n=1 Tax=Rubrolithibacter danxiaensis TaxID=3390805 RepID=UPI003BF81F39